MIKVKMDDDLFNEAKFFGDKIKAWSGYVRNDIELTQEELTEFVNMTNKHISALETLKTKFLRHIQESNK